MRARATAIAASILLCVTTVGAQVRAIGPEFQVNISVEGSQILPDVAASGKRRYTIIWGALFEEPARDGHGIRARGFRRKGQSINGESLITVDERKDERSEADGAIACTLDGACVVAWEAEGSDESVISAKIINTVEAASSSTFEVSSRQGVVNQGASVARNDDGISMIVWHDGGATLTAPPIVAMGRIFDPSGTPLTPPFPLSAVSTNTRQPQVTASASGDFIVAWWGQGPDVSAGFDIFVRRFDAGGNATRDEFIANEFTEGTQSRPAIAGADDDGYLVVWESAGPNEASTGVYARRFTSDDTPLAPTHHVNTFEFDSQVEPAAENDGAGGFFVAWVSLSGVTGPGQDGSGPGVFGRRLLSDGTSEGLEFQINSYTKDAQGWPAWPIGLAARDGNILATWQSQGQDTFNEGVFAQRFRVTPGAGPLCGDAHAQDLRLDMRDALQVLRATAGLRPCLSCLCDADGSGSVAGADALVVLRRVVGISATTQCPACDEGEESPAGAFGFGYPE